MNRKLFFPDVVRETGITERNIKFWVSVYKLPVTKEGRNTAFSLETVEALRLIQDLTATKLVTSRMITIILKQLRGVALTADETAALRRLEKLRRLPQPEPGPAVPAPRASRRYSVPPMETPDEIL